MLNWPSRIARISRTRGLHELQLGILVGLVVVLVRQWQQLVQLVVPESPSWLSLTIVQFFSLGFDNLAFGAGLAIVGFVLAFKVDARTESPDSATIKEILQSVEAAAAGDLSRVPTKTSSGDLGHLQAAVGRLISVLGRSENLIYLLSASVESSTEAIVGVDLDGTITSWNKGAQRIYGFSIEEVKNKSISMLAPAAQGAELIRQLEKVGNGEKIQPFEVKHQARNGRTVTGIVRLTAILDSTHKIIGASFCAQELHQFGSDPNLKHHASVVPDLK